MSRINRLMLKGARMQAVLAPTIWNARKKVWRHIDETRPLESPPEAGRWAVLQVAPRMELKASEALRDAGYHAWYPQTIRTKTIRTKTNQRLFQRKKFNEPLFVRYVFAAAAEPVRPSREENPGYHAHYIERPLMGGRKRSAIGMSDCEHVTRIIGYVPQALLDNLSGRQSGGEFVISDKRVAFRAGEKVKVANGPFGGLDGIVHRSERDRVAVLMSFFGGETIVEFEASQVEAA